jgi:hypothetical protein
MEGLDREEVRALGYIANYRSHCLDAGLPRDMRTQPQKKGRGEENAVGIYKTYVHRIIE